MNTRCLLFIILLALLWHCPAALTPPQHVQQLSSSSHEKLDNYGSANIYSGRQNPFWKLSAANISAVIKELSKLASAAPSNSKAEVPHPHLGYSGYTFYIDGTSHIFGEGVYTAFHGANVSDKKVFNVNTDAAESIAFQTAPVVIQEQIEAMKNINRSPKRPNSRFEASRKINNTKEELDKIVEEIKSAAERYRDRVSSNSTQSRETGRSRFRSSWPIPQHNPAYWHDQFLRCNNCYGFGVNRKTNVFPQPGFASRGHGCVNFANGDDCTDGAIRDGLVDISFRLDRINYVQLCDQIGQVAAQFFCTSLHISVGVDYHWIRHEGRGYNWAHKLGPGRVEFRFNEFLENISGYDLVGLFIVHPWVEVSGPPFLRYLECLPFHIY